MLDPVRIDRGREDLPVVLVLAGGLRVLPVHVEAERAAVDLRGAQPDQLAQAPVELDRGLERQHGGVRAGCPLGERKPARREGGHSNAPCRESSCPRR